MNTKKRRKQQSYGIGYTHYGSQNHLMTSTWPCLEAQLKRQKRRTHNKSGFFFSRIEAKNDQEATATRPIASLHSSWKATVDRLIKLTGKAYRGWSSQLQLNATTMLTVNRFWSLDGNWPEWARPTEINCTHAINPRWTNYNKKPHAKHRSCGLHFRYTVIVRDSILYGVHKIFKTIDLQCIVLGWNETWTVLGRKRL